MVKDFDVAFKTTFEGLVTVRAESASEAAMLVRKNIAFYVNVDEDEVEEISSRTHIQHVVPQGELES